MIHSYTRGESDTASLKLRCACWCSRAKHNVNIDEKYCAPDLFGAPKYVTYANIIFIVEVIVEFIRLICWRQTDIEPWIYGSHYAIARSDFTISIWKPGNVPITPTERKTNKQLDDRDNAKNHIASRQFIHFRRMNKLFRILYFYRQIKPSTAINSGCQKKLNQMKCAAFKLGISKRFNFKLILSKTKRFL